MSCDLSHPDWKDRKQLVRTLVTVWVRDLYLEVIVSLDLSFTI
jgi:hypothetical protein